MDNGAVEWEDRDDAGWRRWCGGVVVGVWAGGNGLCGDEAVEMEMGGVPAVWWSSGSGVASGVQVEWRLW